MSSARTHRSLCSVCGKTPSLSFCTGCEKVFCSDHAGEHRDDLGKLLEQIINEHNRCQETLVQYTEESTNHPLVKQINDWEVQSVEKIRQVAGEARKQVMHVFMQFATNTMATIKTLTDTLKKAQSEESFLEKDLRQAMDKLTLIKKQLEKPPTIHIRRGIADAPLIPKLLVSVCDIFDKASGKVLIKDEGKLIVNSGANGYGTVRSQGEYSVGKHRFRLKIDHTGSQKWNMIGIVSKTVAIQPTPFNTLSAFGWLANNFVCTNGKVHADAQGYKCDWEKNDVLELTLDCQQNSIRSTNERTRSTHELKIDPNLCPFPWQVHVGLYYAKDRIRLLWK